MKNLVIDPALWHSEPCSKLHCPCIFICKYLLQRVISLAQGLEFLLHFWCWVLTVTFLRYPVVALCCGYPEALGLRGRVSSRAQANHKWGECWGRSSHISGLYLGNCMFGPPAGFRVLTTRMISTTLSWQIHLFQQWARVRVGFHTFISSG